MTDNVIQMKQNNVLRVKLKTADVLDKDGKILEEGQFTGEYLEFDMEDIELPLRLDECDFKHRKNREWLKNQYLIIDKKQDIKGKRLLSKNEEDKIKTLQEFYKREIEVLDLFLGKNGTQKILNAMNRNPYLTMFDDIIELLDPILPQIKSTIDNIPKRIKEKYSNNKESDIIDQS